MKKFNLEDILIKLQNIRKQVPVISYSRYKKELIIALEKENKAFQKEDIKLAMTDVALNKSFTI